MTSNLVTENRPRTPCGSSCVLGPKAVVVDLLWKYGTNMSKKKELDSKKKRKRVVVESESDDDDSEEDLEEVTVC